MGSVWLRRFMEETWRQLSAPDLRAALPLYLEVIDSERAAP